MWVTEVATIFSKIANETSYSDNVSNYIWEQSTVYILH